MKGHNSSFHGAPQKHRLRGLILGGLLPLLAYAWIEESYGILWGLSAGMVLGIGEILWEWRTQKRVQALTLGTNGALLVLGGISWITQEGIWFKLQPSLMEALMAFFLWGTLLARKSFLWNLMLKQGAFPPQLTAFRPSLAKQLQQSLQGLTFRLGLFFALHAVLAAWAALYWSTAAWAALKGIGLTATMLVYLVVESLVLRYRLSTIHE